jgi:hypothetical protein
MDGRIDEYDSSYTYLLKALYIRTRLVPKEKYLYAV